MELYSGHIYVMSKRLAHANIKKALIGHRQPDFHKWGKYIYDVLAPEFARQSENLEFMDTSHATVTAVAGRECVSDMYKAIEEGFGAYVLQHFKVYFPVRTRWPRFFRVDGMVIITATSGFNFVGGDIVLLDHPVWRELRDEVTAYNKAALKAIGVSKRFLNGVKKVIDHYDTLDEAVAALPALRYMLPEELQTQDLAFDGTPKPLPNGVNIAELTAIITRAKLGV